MCTIMNKIVCSSFFICINFSLIQFGYSQVNDAALWTSVSLEKKISQKLTVNLSEEIRFNENISEFGMALTELGAEYRFYKAFTLGASFRFAQKRRVDDFYSIRYRYSFDLSYKHKIKKMSITLAEKYQLHYADVNSSENGKVPERFLRTKLTFKYDLEKKYTPYASCELFYLIGSPVGNEFVTVRYEAGFKYAFNKKASLDLYYMIDKEIHVNDPLTSYITGIGFNYSF